MKNNYTYTEIIQDKLGKKYMHTVDYIKVEQCRFCTKIKSKKCRLNIQNDKCINYKYIKISR